MLKTKKLKELLHNNEIEENKHGNDGGDSVLVSLLDLPESVMVDITLRLPKETILCCRLVCKQWLNMISELPFPNIHQDKLFSGSALLVVNGNNTFELLNFSANDDDIGDNVRPTRCAVTFDLPKKGQLRVIDSCNGLICLSHTCSDDNNVTLFVANPILGECVALPKPRRVKRQCLASYAFGFSPCKQQYEVLSIISELFISHPNEERGEICVLGIDSTWKSVGNLPFPDDERFVTVDGAFHWLAVSPQCRDHIYSLNIVGVELQKISLPAPLCGVQSWMTLGVLFDHLCVVKSMTQCASSVIDIWLMKLYGNPLSWTKQYTLQLNCPMGFPARAWKNEEVAVWRSIHCPLRSHSLARDRFIQIEVSNHHRYVFEAVTYIPSLISLKNVMMGKHYIHRWVE
ncbi:F-box protein At3g07870-like [Henckelia pumila]|uniref:F-box protein At3g07870-like n=1 Tax=Henckelia pumila TaxID=405737 RepID=UPI003C6E6864